MARITEMPRPIQPVWIYDVSNPVGMKWPNKVDDVKLLQYALNKIIAKEKLPDRNGKPTLGPMGMEYPPIAQLKVDGIFGRKTEAALKAYQGSSIQGNRCVLADGQADPVYKYISELGGDPISPKNMTIMTKVPGYTMYKLAKDMISLYGKMMDDSELPVEVQTSLRAQKM